VHDPFSGHDPLPIIKRFDRIAAADNAAFLDPAI
jgi:hypothetical protein